MKKLILFFPLLLLLVSSNSADKIRIANGEWPPLVSEQLKDYGVVSHIVKEAFAAGGIEVEYGFFPWPRAYKYAEEGTWDGTLLWSKYPERKKYFYGSTEGIYYSRNVFFHLRSRTFTWKTLNDLKPYMIGLTRSYVYEKNFDRLIKKGILKSETASTDLQNLKKLLAGRIDIFPCNIDVGLDIIRKNFSPEDAQKISYSKRVLYEDYLYLLLSKKNPDNIRRIKIFDRELRRMKDNGTFDLYYENFRKGLYELNQK